MAQLKRTIVRDTGDVLKVQQDANTDLLKINTGSQSGSVLTSTVSTNIFRNPLYVNSGLFLTVDDTNAGGGKLHQDGTDLKYSLGGIDYYVVLRNPDQYEGNYFAASGAEGGAASASKKLVSGNGTDSTSYSTSDKKITYFSDGTPHESTKNIGDVNKPIYISGGEFKELSGSVGSDGKTLMYLNSGVLTASSQTVGSNGKTLMYLNSGTLTASGEDAGGPTQPIYMNKGVLTNTTYQLNATFNGLGSGADQAAAGNHTHATSIATTTDTDNVLGLEYGKKYKLSTGGTYKNFTMPAQSTALAAIANISGNNTATYPYRRIMRCGASTTYGDIEGTFYLTANCIGGAYYLFRVEQRSNDKTVDPSDTVIKVLLTNSDPANLKTGQYNYTSDGAKYVQTDIFVKVGA